MTPKGYPIEGSRDDIEKQGIQLTPKYATVVPKGVRRGLDTVSGGYFEVANSVLIDGGDLSVINLNGHSIMKGDLIRFVTTVNPVGKLELFVDEIIDANNVKLAGALDASLTVGDEIEILRYISPKVAPDGSSLATVNSGPIRFVRDSVPVEVTEDTGTPSNNLPLPVKLTSVTGDINITANDLNVQLTHTGLNPDSIQIGDGTNILSMTGTGEATVNDADLNTAFGTQADAVATNDGGTFSFMAFFKRHLSRFTDLLNTYKQDGDAVAAANLNNIVMGSDGTNYRVLSTDAAGAVNVNVAGSALPTGAATEAKQDDTITQLTALNATDFATETTLTALTAAVAKETTLASLEAKDFATETTLAAMNTAVAKEATLQNIDTNVATLATEATLAALSAKLPALLGPQAEAGSLSVTFANDTRGANGVYDVVAFNRVDLTATTAAYTEVLADVGAFGGKKVKVFMKTGTPLFLAVGAAAAEVDRCIIPAGGFSDGAIELDIPANGRLSVKSIGVDITTPIEFIINVMG